MLRPRPWVKRVAGIGLAAGAVLVASTYLGGGQRFAEAATAPSLGTATSFAVLGSSTVTNTGPSTIGGSLGVSPGNAVTGFPPGVLTSGTIHAGDATAAQARNDTNTAYTAIAGQPCDFTLTGQDLGGKTLLPGVYCFSSTAQLTGALTLNALGNPNAVFIFKIGSALTTASNSSVLVINGAQACNTFWQVGSSATLGTTTRFVGNILALTSITLNTGASVAGRALALTGAVTLDTNDVTIPGCLVAPPAPTPTPTPSPSPTPSATPSPTSTPISSSSPTPSPTPSPILTATPTPIPTVVAVLPPGGIGPFPPGGTGVLPPGGVGPLPPGGTGALPPGGVGPLPPMVNPPIAGTSAPAPVPVPTSSPVPAVAVVVPQLTAVPTPTPTPTPVPVAVPIPTPASTPTPTPLVPAPPIPSVPVMPGQPPAQRPATVPAQRPTTVLDQRRYTVQEGDTLETIAWRELGDARRWQEIFALNRDAIEDPNLIAIGQVLILPT